VEITVEISSSRSQPVAFIFLSLNHLFLSMVADNGCVGSGFVRGRQARQPAVL
jgi:hypothetical protein